MLPMTTVSVPERPRRLSDSGTMGGLGISALSRAVLGICTLTCPANIPRLWAMNAPDIPALRAEVIARKGQWAALARVGELDYSWVVRFARGPIAEPRLSRLQTLRDALDRLPIDARPQCPPP